MLRACLLDLLDVFQRVDGETQMAGPDFVRWKTLGDSTDQYRGAWSNRLVGQRIQFDLWLWCLDQAIDAGKKPEDWRYDEIWHYEIDNFNFYRSYYIYIIEGNLEVKLPTIWRDEKQSREEAERRERLEERRSEEKESEERRCRCAKRWESRETLFFQWFVAPEGRKVGSLKRRARSQLARWEMKKCTPLWREAHFEVKMYKTHHSRTTFGSCDVEKVHAVVARSTFPSQNAQSTPGSDDFWKLRCRKSARRCGAKHISKSKCTKHTILGPLLEVEMSKKCTPLWREAHFQVKSVKNWRSRTTFGGSDVEKVSKKCTPLWREAHFEVKSVKNWGLWAFFTTTEDVENSTTTTLT